MIELNDLSDVIHARDAIMADLDYIAALAYQYRIRPAAKGGGNNSYKGFQMPERLAVNPTARYSIKVLDANHIRITATSVQDYGFIMTTVDENGKKGQWTFSGRFQ